VLVKNKIKKKTFLYKEKLKEFVICKANLQDWLKEVMKKVKE
jgi:hypothetical protein